MLSALEKLLARVNEIAKESMALANPIRLLILTIIASRKSTSWLELKQTLEKLIGPVNPNTMAFHINKLVEVEYISREGPQRSPRYTAKKIPGEVEELLKNLDEALREVEEHG